MKTVLISSAREGVIMRVPVAARARYAYPYSENAAKLGCARLGCWYLADENDNPASAPFAYLVDVAAYAWEKIKPTL